MLTLSFGILKYLGFWQPDEWLPHWKTKLYTIYTIITVFLCITSIISELLGLLSCTGIDEFINNSILLLSLVADCGKMIVILWGHQRIIHLIKILHTFPCKPENPNENKIHNDNNRIIT